MESRFSFLTRWSARRFDAAVFVLAVAARLAALGVFQAKGLGDAYGRDRYFNLALAWLGQTPMPDFDATHPPLYTFLIACILGPLGTSSQLPILFLHVLVGAGTVLPRRVGSGPSSSTIKTARLATLWLALDPVVIFFTPQLQTETLFVAMILAFFPGALCAVG